MIELTTLTRARKTLQPDRRRSTEAVTSRFGVVPRHGTAADLRWFEASPGYMLHVVNAWEVGHEIVELANDPFITNTVPEWSFSLPPLVPNGCSNVLETGDPLERAIFQAQRFGFTYPLQDEAFLSWFARQTPSIGYAGR